jgi:pyridoxal phosphate enzyme (YggS family)
MPGIAENLEKVRERIAAAEREFARAGQVRLIAVSKLKPAEAVREAYAAGQRDFGENYVQELAQKAAELADLPGIVWHFIGHLQRNKAKAVCGVAGAVHTVDSVRLAEELGKRALGGVTRPLPVLVEVNVGGEEQKSGCDPAELADVLVAIEAQPSLRLAGLMTVPPAMDDPRAARPFFDTLAMLRQDHGGAPRLPELSMGMSHDLEAAVAAGATFVRVGTAIFGERS